MTDLILHNANIVTMDLEHPVARMVAVKDGMISAVSSDDSPEALKDKLTRIIDCKGRTVLPGFIDAHCHIYALAGSLVTLNLSPRNNVCSIKDIQSMLKKQAEITPGDSWIRGKGYNEFYLEEKRHLTCRDLDEAVPDHPVKLTHRSGHAHVLNTKAMRLAGISIQTPEPPGGIIDRDLETGEPSGLFFEMGVFLARKIPPIGKNELKKGIQLADQVLLSKGITSVHDTSAGNNQSRWDLFKRWKNEALLTSRVNMMLGYDAFMKLRKKGFPKDSESNQLRFSGVKIILDEITGRIHPAQDDLNNMVLDIHKTGAQASLHAIEETAVKAACTAIEYALDKIPNQDHRHRIEHCSICPPTLAERLAASRIVVVSQPPFIYFNGERYRHTVPTKQLEHLYPFRTLLEKSVHVAGSSDCPIVPANNLAGIFSAVSRKDETGNVLSKNQGISPEAAIRLSTSSAAFASFEEGLKGSITKGKLADFIVLSKNPASVPSDEIREIEIKMTIVDGKVVWRK